MEFDDKDALWNALGKASRKEASPYFVRKVLRDVHLEKNARPKRSWTARLLLRWLVPVAACGIVVATWHARQETTIQIVKVTETQDAATFNEYFDSAADLQSLVAYEAISDWSSSN